MMRVFSLVICLCVSSIAGIANGQSLLTQVPADYRHRLLYTQDRHAIEIYLPEAAFAPSVNFLPVAITNSELNPTTKRSSAYLAKLGSHIKRYIVYIARNGEERALNPMARFEVKVTPDGEITSIRLLQSSGFRNWDLTAARAIEKSSPLPLPEEGGPPEEFEVLMQPNPNR